MKITAHRTHEICCGHRVVGHEGKCQHLHGHNYTFEFVCEADGLQDLDEVGRVIDFGVMKTTLCRWLEENYDHKMLIWANDPQYMALKSLDPHGVIAVPFNPTAENIASHFLRVVAPGLLVNTRAVLVQVTVHETGKCSATAAIDNHEARVGRPPGM